MTPIAMLMNLALKVGLVVGEILGTLAAIVSAQENLFRFGLHILQAAIL